MIGKNVKLSILLLIIIFSICLYAGEEEELFAGARFL